jgi:hypothetical protein
MNDVRSPLRDELAELPPLFDVIENAAVTT